MDFFSESALLHNLEKNQMMTEMGVVRQDLQRTVEMVQDQVSFHFALTRFKTVYFLEQQQNCTPRRPSGKAAISIQKTQPRSVLKNQPVRGEFTEEVHNSCKTISKSRDGPSCLKTSRRKSEGDGDDRTVTRVCAVQSQE